MVVLPTPTTTTPSGSAARSCCAAYSGVRPARPSIMGLAIGPDVDPARLDEIARATGGRSFVVTDPARIGNVFFAALGALSKA